MVADAQANAKTASLTLSKAQVAYDESQLADKQLQADIRDTDQIKQASDLNSRQLAVLQEQANHAIEPIAPTPDDVRDLRSPVDNRLAIAACSSGGIFVLFAIAIMLTLLGAARETHHTYTPAMESLETTALPTKIETEENEPAVA